MVTTFTWALAAGFWSDRIDDDTVNALWEARWARRSRVRGQGMRFTTSNILLNSCFSRETNVVACLTSHGNETP